MKSLNGLFWLQFLLHVMASQRCKAPGQETIIFYPKVIIGLDEK
jgi:hypothetical protein